MNENKYKAFIILLFLLNINVYAQKNFINFDKIKVENISSIEENFNSKVNQSELEFVESTKDSIIRYGKLFYYSRPENKIFGKINVTYFYLKKDSIVRKVNYNWIPSKNSNFEDYNLHFDKTVNEISSLINFPIGDQGKLSIKNEEIIHGYKTEFKERRVTWDYKGTKILILMVWSEKNKGYISTSIKWEK
jgi:hypothetical protein